MLQETKHQAGALRKNRALRKRFKELGLDVEQVWSPSPGDVELENCGLSTLLGWALAYRACPDRQKLEERGYMYPPIEPDFDPDNDWLIFESWMQGKPVSWRFEQEYGAMPSAEGLSEEEVVDKIRELTDKLAERQVVVEYQDGIPARLAYSELCRYLRESEFEIMASGATCHLTGCTGYCPGCFQRPWCDMGMDLSWPEDEEQGTMALPEACRPFVEAIRRP